MCSKKSALYSALLFNQTRRTRKIMAAQLLRRALGSRSSQILPNTTTASAGPNYSLLASVARAFSSATTPITATLFPGDGIGPEIAESVKQVSPPSLSSYSELLLKYVDTDVCIVFLLVLLVLFMI